MRNLITVFLGVMFTGIVMAQNEKTAEERAKLQTEKMTTELSLTNDQKSKVYEINLGINQKNDGLKSSGLNDEEKKKALQHNNEARKEMIKAVLSPEQQVIMEKKLAERKEIRHQVKKEVRKEIKDNKKSE